MNLKHERKRKIRQTDKNGKEKETEFREYKERGKIKKKEETHTRTHKRKKKNVSFKIVVHTIIDNFNGIDVTILVYAASYVAIENFVVD